MVVIPTTVTYALYTSFVAARGEETVERNYKKVALNAAIILVGGAILTALNLLPWVAVGLPVVIALTLNELVTARPKALTFDERREARQAAAAANPPA